MHKSDKLLCALLSVLLPAVFVSVLGLTLPPAHASGSATVDATVTIGSGGDLYNPAFISWLH